MILIEAILFLLCATVKADTPEGPGVVSTELFEDLKKFRDPFQMPESQKSGQHSAVSELERYAVGSFSVVGIITGLQRYRALLQNPEGKKYLIGEKTKVGQSGGSVKRIYPDRVVIQEKATNLLGQMESIDTVLYLKSDSQITPSSGLGSR